MVLDSIVFGTALIGSGLASYYDLKTTEVPDWIFYAMLIIGVPVVALNSFLYLGFDNFVLSSVTGLGFLAFGALMYKIGQWGGADAVLLSIVAFLIPKSPEMFSPSLILPFPVALLINVFVIGTIYIIFYSLVYAFMNRWVVESFVREFRKSRRLFVILPVSLFVFISALMIYLDWLLGLVSDFGSVFYGALLAAIASTALFAYYKFARIIEEFGFKRKIPVSKLNVGDMLLDTKELRGIDKQELEKVKKSGKKTVWIKDGVRFVPAILLALLFTLLVGDSINLITLFTG